MNEIKSCGVILCAVIVCVIFKNLKHEYALFIRMLVAISAFFLTLGMMYPIFNYVNEITKNTSLNKYMPTIFKSLGIAYTVQLTADICRDAGEATLAERICTIGKIGILVLSLPLIKELINLSQTVLE